MLISACMSGFKRAKFLFRAVHHEIIPRRQHRFRFAAERRNQARIHIVARRSGGRDGKSIE